MPSSVPKYLWRQVTPKQPNLQPNFEQVSQELREAGSAVDPQQKELIKEI